MKLALLAAIALLCVAPQLADAATRIPLDISAHVVGELTPDRIVTVHVRTAPGAQCRLTELVSDIHLQRTATAGRATWRWRPSLWANGPDTVAVTCVKGNSRRSVELFLLLGSLEQISVIRDFDLHLVYWAPAAEIPADVPTSVWQLETDVKASLDAGAVDNPFAIPRAYGDSLGAGDPRIASIDSTTDPDPYPPAPPGSCFPKSAHCLTSGEIGDEMTKLARQHGWAAGNRTLIVVITGSATTVCFPTQPCSLRTEVCGYHAMTSAGYEYAEVIMSGVSAGCDVTTASSYAVALIGHEQNEAVVDPWGYGVEVADPCEGQFASVPINGNIYELPALVEHDRCTFAYS